MRFGVRNFRRDGGMESQADSGPLQGTTRPAPDGQRQAGTGGTPVPPGKWSCHFVDIYGAVGEGLPVDVEELREALNDPEGWAQEFECQFWTRSRFCCLMS